jgi:diguanylate cyclase (GGDEF)-like protein
MSVMDPAPTTSDVAASSGYHRRVLPRLTSRAFRDLMVWMAGFGLLIGALFPYFVVLMGVPARLVLTPAFFLATLGAGLVVGMVNFALARGVVGSRLRLLCSRMARVESNLRRSVYDDGAVCSPEACSIPVDSADELGDAASGFNRLVDALALSHRLTAVAREFAATLQSHIELEPLCDDALLSLTRAGGFDAGALCVIVDGELSVIASDGISDIDSLCDSAPVQHALRRLQTFVVAVPDDVQLDAGLVGFRPRSVMAVPLQVRRVPVGVAVVASTDPVDQDTVRMVEQLVANLAVAVDNALGHERLQKVAALDPLTGLYNRRFGLERLAQDFTRAVRNHEPLGLLLFDIDDFKVLNDTFGHQAGDKMLRAVADSARAVLREGDTVLRYGGEEFLAVLPGAGTADVEQLGQRVRLAVEAVELRVDSLVLRSTVSIGAAAFPDPTIVDVDDLVRRADAAMYESKSAGKNRLSFAN